MQFSAEGRDLGALLTDNTFRILSAEGAERLIIRLPSDRFKAFRMSHDARRVAIVTGEGALFFWNTESDRDLLRHPSYFYELAFSPDGTHAATTHFDSLVKIWNAGAGREELTLRGHLQTVQCAKYSRDGRRLATAAFDKTIRIWDAVDGHELQTIRLPRSALSIAFTTDDRSLVVGTLDGSLRLIDTETGRESALLAQHTIGLMRVACSPDGRTVAASSFDGTLLTCDLLGERPPRSWKAHESAIAGLAFAGKDGAMLASASDDRTIKLWDAASGSLRTRWQGRTGFRALAFSPDERRIVTASA